MAASSQPTALILFSHGSLLCGAGEAVREHARRLAASGEYATVKVGFLNYSDPSFEAAVESCAASGAQRIVVVPYFLVAGRFVTADLPSRVEAARARHPGVAFCVAEPLGFDNDLVDAALELAALARPPSRWREDLWRAPEFCDGREDCPLRHTMECPAGRAGMQGAGR
jgi:sirohydrochlorin cobaltochelatase